MARLADGTHTDAIVEVMQGWRMDIRTETTRPWCVVGVGTYVAIASCGTGVKGKADADRIAYLINAYGLDPDCDLDK